MHTSDHPTNRQQTTPITIPCRHVAVCAFPFGAHATALLSLVRQMAATAAAANVTFTYLNFEASNAALFGSRPSSNVVPMALPGCEAYEGTGSKEAFVGFMGDVGAILRRGIAAAEAEVGVGVGCVVGDAFLWCCGEIAREKGVPWFPIWTSGLASLSCHLYTDIIRSRFKEVQERLDEKVGDCVPGFTNIRFGDLPGEVLGDFESPFGKMAYKMAQALPQATALVANCFDELAPTVSHDLATKMKLFNLGPFSSLSRLKPPTSDKYGCIPWLDGHEKARSVVYVAFGTFSMPPMEELVALCEALEHVKVPFIWSLNDKMKSQLPPAFLQWIDGDEMVGKIVPWAPQREILVHPNVGVFITHCGWLSVLESIASGMPMICRSIIGDQMLNQKYVVDELGFGIGVDGGVFSKESVAKALQEVLMSEVGEQLRANAMELKKVVDETTKVGGRLDKGFSTWVELVTSET